jgi:serine/threonine protein kinase
MSAAPQQRYRVIERLASGGMAEVYLAESAGIEGFKKQVAIKRVLPHLSEKKRFIAMFLDEARLSAHLTHSNVAQVFDIGVGDNAYFIVMEYVNGADLKAIIDFMKKDERAFPVEAAVFIAAKICEGLSYAHELTNDDGVPLRIVHRDMSPPNVLLTKYGEVKIVDFGLAKATSQLEKSEAGIIKGKFSYLSPEAALGDEVDHRTDIFAVGIILWEMLAGRRLFLGETDFQTVKLVQQAKIPALSKDNPSIPPELDKILAKTLARDPAHRYPNARDLGRELTNFLYDHRRPVSAYDVAELVVGAMRLRKKVKPDGGVIIDRLIEEALLEFKSLQEDDKGHSRESAPEPARTGGAFEDISSWADEISLSPSQQADKSAQSSKGKEGASTKAPASEARPGRATAKGEADSATAGKAEDDSKAPTTPKAAKPKRDSKPEAAPLAVASVRDSLAPIVSGSGGTVKMLLVAAAIAIIVVGAWIGGLFGGSN